MVGESKFIIGLIRARLLKRSPANLVVAYWEWLQVQGSSNNASFLALPVNFPVLFILN